MAVYRLLNGQVITMVPLLTSRVCMVNRLQAIVVAEISLATISMPIHTNGICGVVLVYAGRQGWVLLLMHFYGLWYIKSFAGIEA